MKLTIFKSLMLNSLLFLAIMPVAAESKPAQSNSALLRLGKTASFASLTGIFGMMTAVTGYTSILRTAHILGDAHTYLRNPESLPDFGIPTKNHFSIQVLSTSTLSPVTLLNGYLTFYFANKTKEAYSAKA